MSSESSGNWPELQLTAQAGLAATPDLSFLAAFLARPVLQIDEPAKFSRAAADRDAGAARVA